MDEKCELVFQKIFYQHRLDYFKAIEKIIKEKNDRTVCSLQVLPCRKLFSTLGRYSVVFSIYNIYNERKEFENNIQAIVKVTDSREDEFMTEKLNNNFINAIVQANISPHFVLNFDYRICKDMCTFLSNNKSNYDSMYINWSHVKKGYCVLSFQEMFHGDVFSDIFTFEHNVILSLIIQVIMGCMALHHKNVEHNDLHLGNVFYKHLLNGENTYFSYKIGEDVYLVKHCKFLFVIGDYGRLKDNTFMIRPDKNYIDDLSLFINELKKKLNHRDNRYDGLLDILIEKIEELKKNEKKSTYYLISEIFQNIIQYCGQTDDYLIMKDIFKKNELKGNVQVNKIKFDIDNNLY